MPTTPTFKQVCAIIADCARAHPHAGITDLSDLARTVLAKRKLEVDVPTFNRAIDAVLAAGFKRTVEAKPTGQFRSKLEDRWAKAFTRAQIAWLYEPQAFALEVPYVPDFYLPTLKVWIEIKPVAPDEPARYKAQLLAAHTKRPVYVVSGPPAANSQGEQFASVRITARGAVVPDTGWIPASLYGALEQFRQDMNWELAASTLHAHGLLPQPPSQQEVARRRRDAAVAAQVAAQGDVTPTVRVSATRRRAARRRVVRRGSDLPPYLREHARPEFSVPAYLAEHLGDDDDA